MLYFLYNSAGFLHYLVEVLRNQIQKPVIRPVVSGPINLSEFFLIFEMFIKKKMGCGD